MFEAEIKGEGVSKVRVSVKREEQTTVSSSGGGRRGISKGVRSSSKGGSCKNKMVPFNNFSKSTTSVENKRKRVGNSQPSIKTWLLSSKSGTGLGNTDGTQTNQASGVHLYVPKPKERSDQLIITGQVQGDK